MASKSLPGLCTSCWKGVASCGCTGSYTLHLHLQGCWAPSDASLLCLFIVKIWPVLSQAELLKLKIHPSRKKKLLTVFLENNRQKSWNTDELGQILCQLFLKQILEFGLYLCLPWNFLSFFKERGSIFLRIDLLTILCYGSFFFIFERMFKFRIILQFYSITH